MKKLVALGLAALMVALGSVSVAAKYDYCLANGHDTGDCIAENCDGVMHYMWYQCKNCGEYISDQNWCTEDCEIYQNGGGWKRHH